MKWNSRIRCALVCLGFTALFSAFSFRLVYLQMIKHDEYAGLAAEKHVYKQAIYAERGSILDANNEVLAHNTPVETVVADATHLNNREALIPLLSDALKIPASELSEKLEGDRRYIVLKREVPEAVAVALKGETARAKPARHLFRARFDPRLSEWLDALSRDRVHGLRSPRHSRGGIFHGRISPRSGWLPLHRAQSRRSGNGALSRPGAHAAQWLPGSPDDRSQFAKHR